MAVDPPVNPTIPAPAAAVEITLPGGATITSAPAATAGFVTELSQVQSLMAAMGPALAGLSPVLKILDALFAMFDTVGAAAEIPVDPTGFFEALANLAEKMAALAPLVPQVSVPATIISSVRAIRSFTSAIRSSVAQIAAQAASAEALLAQATAAADAELAAQAQAQLASANALAAHAVTAMGPLGNILDIVGGLLDIVPLGFSLPSIDGLEGLAPQELVDALDVLLSVLDALPV